MLLDGLPDDPIIDDVVSMDQDVSETDDAAVIRDLVHDFGIDFLEPGEASPMVMNQRSTAARSKSSVA